MPTQSRPSTAGTEARTCASPLLWAANTLNSGPGASEEPPVAVRWSLPTPVASSTGLGSFSDPKWRFSLIGGNFAPGQAVGPPGPPCASAEVQGVVGIFSLTKTVGMSGTRHYRGVVSERV